MNNRLYRHEADELEGMCVLKFTLTYQGPLKSSQPMREHCPLEDCPAKPHKKALSLAENKMAVREQFHRQLAVLWEAHPFLRDAKVHKQSGPDNEPITRPLAFGWACNDSELTHLRDYIAEQKVGVDGFNFVPLFGQETGLSCALDILLLRDAKGGALNGHGDLDNKVKTLIDGMKVPATSRDLVGKSPKDPYFYTLMVDDDQVSSLSVRTERLLYSPDINDCANSDIENVLAIIDIELRPVFATPFNLGFF